MAGGALTAQTRMLWLAATRDALFAAAWPRPPRGAPFGALTGGPLPPTTAHRHVRARLAAYPCMPAARPLGRQAMTCTAAQGPEGEQRRHRLPEQTRPGHGFGGRPATRSAARRARLRYRSRPPARHTACVTWATAAAFTAAPSQHSSSVNWATVAAFTAAGVALFASLVTLWANRSTEVNKWRRDKELPTVAAILDRSKGLRNLDARRARDRHRGEPDPDADEAQTKLQQEEAEVELLRSDVSQLALIASPQVLKAANTLHLFHDVRRRHNDDTELATLIAADAAEGRLMDQAHTEDFPFLQWERLWMALADAAREDLGISRSRTLIQRRRDRVIRRRLASRLQPRYSTSRVRTLIARPGADPLESAPREQEEDAALLPEVGRTADGNPIDRAD